MPIPDLNQNGELPPGEHSATIDEVATAFGTASERRGLLTAGLVRVATMFKDAGVQFLLIDGSYVTEKENPEDIDGCWSASGNIVVEKIDPIFWNFSTPAEFQKNRMKAKSKYGVDFFIAEMIEGGSGKPFSDFFRTNRDGDDKGIIKIFLN